MSSPNKTTSGAQKNRMLPHCGASAPEIALSKHIDISSELLVQSIVNRQQNNSESPAIR
jgi:hypothetical protein